VTYSIVARDPQTGQLGVAVQTAMFAVGSIVPWARPGVGAVATQSFAEAAYGPRCLDAIATGSNADDALAFATAADPMAVLRQIGVVAADGSAASTTGELCIDHAGHIVGDGFAVQANMMSSADVWPAMASAFTASSGPLARRMFAALVAGQRAGGDARGVMSAALVVVDAQPAAQPGAGTLVDIRVDRSEDPLGELARLLDAADAFAAYHDAVTRLTSGDAAGALAKVDDALALLPGEENFRFLRSGALAASGDDDAAIAGLRSLIADHPSWKVIVEGFAAKGLIAVPPSLTVDEWLGTA